MAVLGPELRVESASLARCERIISELFSLAADGVTLKECADFKQQLVIFAPAAAPTTAVVADMQRQLGASTPQLRLVAVECIRHLAERDPEGVAAAGGNLVPALLALLSQRHGRASKIVASTRQCLKRLLEATAAVRPITWFRVAAATALGGGSSAADDDDDDDDEGGDEGEQQQQQQQQQNQEEDGANADAAADATADATDDVSSPTKSVPDTTTTAANSSGFPTRVFAAELLSRLPLALCGGALAAAPPHHTDLAAASRAADAPELMVTHLGSLVSCGYRMLASDLGALKPMALSFLRRLVLLFRHAIDPFEPDKPLLVQHVAQLYAAVKAALDIEQQLDVVLNGLALATALVESHLVTGDAVLVQRLARSVGAAAAAVAQGAKLETCSQAVAAAMRLMAARAVAALLQQHKQAAMTIIIMAADDAVKNLLTYILADICRLAQGQHEASFDATELLAVMPAIVRADAAIEPGSRLLLAAALAAVQLAAKQQQQQQQPSVELGEGLFVWHAAVSAVELELRASDRSQDGGSMLVECLCTLQQLDWPALLLSTDADANAAVICTFLRHIGRRDAPPSPVADACLQTVSTIVKQVDITTQAGRDCVACAMDMLLGVQPQSQSLQAFFESVQCCFQKQQQTGAAPDEPLLQLARAALQICLDHGQLLDSAMAAAKTIASCDPGIQNELVAKLAAQVSESKPALALLADLLPPHDLFQLLAIQAGGGGGGGGLAHIVAALQVRQTDREQGKKKKRKQSHINRACLPACLPADNRQTQRSCLGAAGMPKRCTLPKHSSPQRRRRRRPAARRQLRQDAPDACRLSARGKDAAQGSSAAYRHPAPGTRRDGGALRRDVDGDRAAARLGE